MKLRLPRLLAGFLTGLFCLFFQQAHATHIYGMDFYYTWVSGNTYTITLVVYGDCGGASFPSLNNATAQVQIINNSNNSTISTINLTQQGNGVEVTPVCPSQALSTICNVPGSTIPGVKRYIYSANTTLTAVTTNWKFRFTGTMSTSSAGRSNSISNIVSGTVTAMEATLNNSIAVGGNNNSPVYTTIPTPFFCVNKPANYNPGAVDPDNDSLTFSLVPGLLSTPVNGTVTYVTAQGYSATAPLHTVPATFNFSTTNGQLAFTPDIGQQSLVVNRVNEYRNGVLVGTSMREMTFVVLTNCNNNPPGGDVFNPSIGATQLNTTTVRVCKAQGNVSFTVLGNDLDGDVINMTWAGLPAGAVFTVTGNNTSSPSGFFSWNLTSVVPGTYNFFVTYTDNGCPLSSKQTLAYSIIVSPDPAITYNLTAAATCTAKGKFTLTPTVNPPWNVTIKQGTTVIHTFPGLNGSQLDSLDPGTYTITSVNSTGCTKDTTITIAPPQLPTGTVTTVNPTCYGGSDGSISVSGANGVSPYTYAVGAGAYGSSGSFTGLTAGSYVLHIRGANACTKDTTVVLNNPPDIYTTVALSKPPCNHFQNGSITLNAYNSVAPYQYALGAGAYGSSGTFGSLFSGPYTVHIKNDIGCIKDTVIVLPDSVKIQAALPLANVLCNGGNTGSVTINATGAYPPYTYANGAGPFGGTNTFTGLTAGTYTFHVKDIEGCFFDTVVTIAEPTVVTASAAVTANVLCNGAATGTVAVTGAGGTPPYTYAVDGGTYGSSATITGLTAGSHTFSVKDNNGCLASASATLTQPTPIVVGWTFVMPLCNGASNGSITLSGSGGVPGYTYAIDASAYSASTVFPSLAGGSHTLHVKDNNGCIKDSIVNLNQPTAVGVTASVTKPICNTLANGKVILAGNSGTPGYTYSQGAGPYGASTTFTPLAAGTYAFHVKDANGCIKDTSITLVDSTVITTSSVVSNVLCFGGNTGSITITGAGGQTAYTYALGANPYSSNNVFGSLVQGTYALHVKDANGCIKDTSIQITQPTVLTVTASKTNVLCNAGSDGTLTISASGGTPAYQYALGAGVYGNTGSFTGLPIGTYVLHAKDANGCIHDTTITITQPSKLAYTLALTNVLCNGGSSGTATVSGSGGTPTYTYAADATAYGAANTLTGLNAGTHVIHMKDANGCIKDTTITITQPTAVAVTASKTDVSCFSGSNGTITIGASGGTPGYTYANGVGPYGASGSFTGLVAGNYTLHAKDANGCIKDTTIEITQPTQLAYTLALTNVLCFGGNTGTATVSGSGGTPAYTYAADAGAYGASNVLTGLNAGTHVIHMKDNKGCIKDTTITITQPTMLAITASKVDVLCNGGTDGSLTISASGGTSAYQYALGAGAYGNTGSFTTLGAGTYVLHAKDANGCIHDTTITITQPAKLAFTLTVTNVLCNGGSTGAVTVNATGGTPAYSYAYDANPFGASSALTGFNAGSHTIHLKDANGCTKDTTIAITQPTVLGIGGSFTQPLCFNTATGVVTITGNGGTTPYTFALDAGLYGASGTFNSISAGTHTIRVKDAKGCTKDSNITIGQPTAVTVSAAIKRPRCSPLVNGIVTLGAGGGTPGYTYAIGTNAYVASPIFSNLGSGTYNFHVKDSKGCIKDTTITVTDSVFLSETLVITNVNCWSIANGSIDITAGGGDNPYTYALGTNPYSAANPITNVGAGTYVLHVKDGNGCIKDSTITVTQPARIVPTATLTQPLCFGNSNGVITIGASGGVPAYTYSQGATPYVVSGTFNGLAIGTYTFHVKDINNCIRDTTVTLTQPSPLKIDSVFLTHVFCFGDATGTATLYASGATPTYTYANDAVPYIASNLLTGLSAGVRTLHVKDANGCIKDTNVTITQPPKLHFGVLSITSATCEGMADGRVVLAGRGGAPWVKGYEYSDDNVLYKDRTVYGSLMEGVHIFYVRDSNNCVTDTSVIVPGYPHINLAAIDVKGPSCFGMEDGVITMNSTGGVPPLTYQLIKPVETNTTGIFDSLTKGTYKLHVQDGKGCFKDTAINMTEPDSLDVRVQITGNDCLGANDGGMVKATGFGGTMPYSFVWNTKPNTGGETVRGLQNGPVSVLMTDANGCTDTANAMVTYNNCCTPYIPNAFTPNGDGKNDLFRVMYKGDISKLEMSVYNRFGQRVYVAYSIDGAWDGTFNGVPQDLGTYFYRIKFICGNAGDNELEFKGDLTLIR